MTLQYVQITTRYRVAGLDIDPVLVLTTRHGLKKEEKPHPLRVKVAEYKKTGHYLVSANRL
jgi:hypothetical protein